MSGASPSLRIAAAHWCRVSSSVRSSAATASPSTSPMLICAMRRPETAKGQAPKAAATSWASSCRVMGWGNGSSWTWNSRRQGLAKLVSDAPTSRRFSAGLRWIHAVIFPSGAAPRKATTCSYLNSRSRSIRRTCSAVFPPGKWMTKCAVSVRPPSVRARSASRVRRPSSKSYAEAVVRIARSATSPVQPPGPRTARVRSPRVTEPACPVRSTRPTTASRQIPVQASVSSRYTTSRASMGSASSYSGPGK